MTVVGALELVAKHRPDLVLMDVAMRHLNGLQATERIVREYPGVRVLILSMYVSEEYAWQALKVGGTRLHHQGRRGGGA